MQSLIRTHTFPNHIDIYGAYIITYTHSYFHTHIHIHGTYAITFTHSHLHTHIQTVDSDASKLTGNTRSNIFL